MTVSPVVISSVSCVHSMSIITWPFFIIVGEPSYYYTPVMTILSIRLRKGMNVHHFAEDLSVRGYKFQDILNII